MTTVEPRAAGRSRAPHRLLAVLLPVPLGLAVWAVAALAGTEPTVTSPAAGPMTIGPLLVTVTALAAGLAGWALLAVLERFTDRARRIWTVVAAAVLALSLPPLAVLDAPTGAKVTLAVMHLTVGIALIVLLRRSRPRRRSP